MPLRRRITRSAGGTPCQRLPFEAPDEEADGSAPSMIKASDRAAAALLPTVRNRCGRDETRHILRRLPAAGADGVCSGNPAPMTQMPVLRRFTGLLPYLPLRVGSYMTQENGRTFSLCNFTQDLDKILHRIDSDIALQNRVLQVD